MHRELLPREPLPHLGSGILNGLDNVIIFLALGAVVVSPHLVIEPVSREGF
jgi:hypothetical protein